MKNLILSIIRFHIIRATKKYSHTDILKALTSSHDEIIAKLEKMKDTKKNKVILQHMITIESWAANRLKMFRGKAFVMDDSFHYKPKMTSVKELKKQFSNARQKTLSLALGLENEATSLKKITHNDLGPLTAMQWMYYLYSHAKKDTKRLALHKK